MSDYARPSCISVNVPACRSRTMFNVTDQKEFYPVRQSKTPRGARSGPRSRRCTWEEGELGAVVLVSAGLRVVVV